MTGIDLVEWMVRTAKRRHTVIFYDYQHQPEGHAIQARLYAEDAGKIFCRVLVC